MSSFLNKFRKDIAAIAWWAAGLFLGLALVSYSPTDPSFNSLGAQTVVKNVCGYFGSFLADIFLQVFGIISWGFVLAAMRLGYFSFKGQKDVFTKSSALVFVLWLINMSSLLALYAGQWQIYDHTIWASGLLGSSVVVVLQHIFNSIGTSIILLSSAIIFLIYYSQQTLSEFFQTPLYHAKKAFMFLSLRAKEFFKKWKPNPKKKSTVEIQQVKSLVDIAVSRESAPNEQSEAVEGAEERSSFNAQILVSDAIEDSETKQEKRREALKRIQRKVANWELPKVSLLEAPPAGGFKVDQRLIARNTQLLEDKLAQFNVRGQVVAVRPGPAVTMFEFKPNADVKISRITELADDLALALSSESLRIIAPMPGRDVVGIETSNPKRETVFLREVLEDPTFWDEKTRLPLALGKQANGETKVVDLRRMPHLLVAGTTDRKSVV